MAFQKKEWKSGDTLSHVELNRIEEGILENSQIEIPEIPDMNNVVKYKEFSAGVDPSKRKTIQLENFDTISAKSTTGTPHNLIMLSKWDKVDVGARGVTMNLNTKDRIQVNDSDYVALDSEVKKVKEQVEPIAEKVQVVETKVGEVESKATGLGEQVAEIKSKAEAVESTVTELEPKVTEVESKVTEVDNKVMQVQEKVTAIETKVDEYKADPLKIGDIVWGEGLVGYFPNDTTGATYEIPNSEDGLKHIVCDEVHIWDQYYTLVLDRVIDEETQAEKMVVGKKSTHTHHDVRGKFELACTYNKNIQFTLDKMDDGRVKIKCFNFWRKIG